MCVCVCLYDGDDELLWETEENMAAKGQTDVELHFSLALSFMKPGETVTADLPCFQEYRHTTARRNNHTEKGEREGRTEEGA